MESKLNFVFTHQIWLNLTACGKVRNPRSSQEISPNRDKGIRQQGVGLHQT
jgi:hypothetical protein